MRETIESIVVAFILAFLFRTFEAEAFVIPTGSMAPTLLGRHKDVECKQCGVHFTVGASDELDDNDSYIPDHRITSAFCPNCRYENPVRDLPAFKGDRILVNKFPYEIGEPHRWSVVVFKYPEDPKINYIKRLVGLPGEVLRIQRGDVYARSDELTGAWTLVRKQDPNKQKVLQLLVYDNNHPARALEDVGWPQRWAAVRQDGAPDSVAGWSRDNAGWQKVPEERAFELSGPSSGAAGHRWLRYRHVVPDERDWAEIAEGRQPVGVPQPRLITDFCSYNAYEGGGPHSEDFGVYWVGDLTLSCRFDVREVGSEGELILELSEGVRRYRCRFNIPSGRATLYFLDDSLDPLHPEERVLAVAESTALKGPGTHDVTFANVDDRLCLWVDGGLVEFEKSTIYDPPQFPGPQESDLIPAGIAAKDANVVVSNLLLERDIYYRANALRGEGGFHHRMDDREEYDPPYSISRLAELLHDPERWYEEYAQHAQPATFAKLAEDEYFVLGDNSPRSKDSRLWSNERQAVNRHAVPRMALVGKAFFIYWPHGQPFLNEGQGFPLLQHKVADRGRPLGEEHDYPRYRVPFYPNVWRMHRIR